MRRIMIVIFAFILAMICTGCFVITLDEYYEIHQDVTQIQSISIHSCSDGETLSDDPIIILEDEQFQPFIEDIEALPFRDKFLLILAAVDPSFQYGDYVIRIVYQDTSIELISNFGFQLYQGADGSYHAPHYEINHELWLEFLEKYIDIAS